MTCHGVGTSRLIGAIADCSPASNRIDWPVQLVPFKCLLIPSNQSYNAIIDRFMNVIEGVCGQGEVVIDDRHCSIKMKIEDAGYVGYTIVIVVGKRFDIDNTFDFISNGRTESCDEDRLISKLQEAL